MILATLVALAAPQASTAMAHDTACQGAAAPLPAGLEGWSRARPAKAGSSAAAATSLAIGAAITAALLPTPQVAYGVQPKKPGEASTSGGVFAFTVTTAGRYRVALGSAAWVDVLSGTTSVESIAHGHGPACSTVRKMVDFDLRAGRYVLQVAGSTTPALPLMVARIG